MNKGIDSYEKDKFVIGKKYWTYYMESTSKGNQLRHVTGVFSAVPSKGVFYNETTKYFEWKIGDVDRTWTEKLNYNLPVYMNGYGIARCSFFETREEAVEAHDREIAFRAEHLDTRSRKNMYKKMYNKSSTPPVSKEEVEAVEWLKSLGSKERKHVLWIKEYLDIAEITNLKKSTSHGLRNI